MEYSIRRWAAAWVGLTIYAAACCVAANPELLALTSAPSAARRIAALYGGSPNVLLWTGPQGMQALVSGVHHAWLPPSAGTPPAEALDFIDVACGTDADFVRYGVRLCAVAADLHRRRGAAPDAVEQIQSVYDDLRRIAALPSGLFGDCLACKADAGALVEALAPPLTEVAAALTAVDAAKSALKMYRKDSKDQLYKRSLTIMDCKHNDDRAKAVKEKADFEKTVMAELEKLEADLSSVRLAAGEKIKRLGEIMEAVTSADAAERKKRELPSLYLLDDQLQGAAEQLRAAVSETYTRHLLEYARRERRLGPPTYVAAYEYAAAVFNCLDTYSKAAYAHSGRQRVSNEELANAINKATTAGAVMPNDSVFFESANPLHTIDLAAHTEAMLRHWAISHPEEITGSYVTFFTWKDMCPSCQQVIQAWAAAGRPILALSHVVCQGQDNQPTKVDAVLKNGVLSPSGTLTLKIPNVLQIRIEDDSAAANINVSATDGSTWYAALTAASEPAEGSEKKDAA